MLDHAILGTLLYDADSENWGKSVALLGHHFRLSVAGKYEPDPSLLSRASALEAELPELVAGLPSFLDREAEQMPELAAEIRSLTLADVAVWWPKQPDVVMVWFNGPSEDRIWHCEFTNGALSALVFDC